MAASDAKPIPIKNAAYRVTFPIFDADGDLVSGAAGLDSEVSKDGGAFTDCTNEATEIATSSGMYYLDLTADEMNADTVAIIVKTSTSGAKTTPIVLYPEEAGDIRVNVTQIEGSDPTDQINAACDTALSDYDAPTKAELDAGLAGLNDPTAATIADAICDELLSGHTDAGSLAKAISDVLADTGTDGVQVAGLKAAALADLFDTDSGTTYASAVSGSVVKEIADNAGGSSLTEAGIADAVCDELLSEHTDAGSVGEALANAGSGASAADIADAVCDEALGGHTDAGSLGQAISDILADTAELQTDDVPGLIAALNDPTAAAIADAICDELLAGHTTAGSLAQALSDILADTGTDGVALSTAVKQAVADEVLKRGVSNVEDAADTLSLAALILAVFKSSISNMTWTITKSDGITTFATPTVTTDANADPITGVS